MKKDEQANVLLSLKNLYRLFTVKDYPVYSTGILGEKSKKGIKVKGEKDSFVNSLKLFLVLSRIMLNFAHKNNNIKSY